MEQKSRPCKSCKGTGKSSWDDRQCSFCEGRGWFDPPDPVAIIRAIRGRKGLRSNPRGLSDREYYVWRMSRFHGGRDVTMPVVAGLRCHGDPFVDELDRLAEAVARKVFGTDMAAAARWGRLLFGVEIPIDGLPPTARLNGPVALDGKPEEEWAELFS